MFIVYHVVGNIQGHLDDQSVVELEICLWEDGVLKKCHILNSVFPMRVYRN